MTDDDRDDLQDRAVTALERIALALDELVGSNGSMNRLIGAVARIEKLL